MVLINLIKIIINDFLLRKSIKTNVFNLIKFLSVTLKGTCTRKNYYRVLFGKNQKKNLFRV